MKWAKKWCISLIMTLCALSGLSGQALKSDTIDVLNYSISLDLKHLSHQQLYGAADITATPRMASIGSFSLDFRKLTIDSLLLNGNVHSQYHYNDTVLHVVLPAPLTPSDTFVLRVVYHGTPLIESYNWGGFHFAPDSTLAFNLGVAFKDYPHNYGRVWFPCLDDFIDRATYNVNVRTAGHHKAVCGGMLIDTSHHTDGTVTWRWHLATPIPTYLASVAVGDFVVIHDLYHGIQDSIPIMIYVRPADSAKAVISFAGLSNMLSIFEDRFGPYRWPRVGYTGTTKGAMEHATNIAMPRNLITGNQQYDWLIAHELAHAWFGNMMTCASSADMWINEGWARYCEAIHAEGVGGWEAYKTYLMDLRKKVLNFTHTQSSGGDGVWLPLSPVGTDHTYGSTVYDKGGLMAHTLRGYLGDSLFFDAVRAMLNHFAFKPVSSYQMRDFLTQHTGINLTPFFEGWVFTPGFPHFSLDSVSLTPYSGGLNATVHVKQKMTGRTTYVSDNVVEVGFYDALLTLHIRRIHFSGLIGTETFWLPFQPVLVVMDPEERLAYASTMKTTLIQSAGLFQFPNQFFRLRVNTLPSDMLVRIEHAFVNPDPMPQPVIGLTLSPNRYWKICGVIPPTASLDGLFTYSTGNQFDNALITNTQDSLIILFRSHAGESWQGVPFIRSGTPTSGVITVPNLRTGEYTLAKWDKSHIGTNRKPESNVPNQFLYPNPARDLVHLRRPVPDTPLNIIFYSLNGATIARYTITAGTEITEISLGQLAPGVYVVEVSDVSGTIYAKEKLTVISR